MDNKRYEEFCKARIVNFRGNYSAKFQAAMEDVKSGLDLKVEKVAEDVLSYLSYETLGQLIEMSLLLRPEFLLDPVARLVSPLAMLCVRARSQAASQNMTCKCVRACVRAARLHVRI